MDSIAKGANCWLSELSYKGGKHVAELNDFKLVGPDGSNQRGFLKVTKAISDSLVSLFEILNRMSGIH